MTTPGSFFARYVASFYPEDVTRRDERRISLLVSLSWVGILVIGLYTVMWSLRGHLTLAFTDGVGTILLALNLTALRIYRNYENNIKFGLAVFSVLLIIIYFNGSSEEATYLWFFLYPIITAFLLGSRRGGIAAALMLVPMFLTSEISPFQVAQESYSTFFSFRLMVAYSVITYLTFKFEQAAEKNRAEINELTRSLEQKVVDRTAELQEKNEQLALEVAERTAAEQKIAHSLKEKEILLKEVHHRTKNNMNVIISLLNLQKWQTTPQNIEHAFELLSHRIHSMSAVHERLYQSENVATLDLGEYVLDLAQHLKASFGTEDTPVQIDHEAEAVKIGLDQAIPLGLALNEIITNAYKHGSKADQALILTTRVSRLDSGDISVIVGDNGPGLPTDFILKKSSSLGTHLIHILLEDQLQAGVEIDSDTGTRYSIRFSDEDHF